MFARHGNRRLPAGPRPLKAVLAAAALFATAPARAGDGPTVDVTDAAGLRRAAAAAKPGTTIRLAPGDYRGGILIENLHGTAKAPIVITAADPDAPPVIRGGNTGLHLVDPRHVELRGLAIEGAAHNGINIDDGGPDSYDTPATGIVLRDLRVRSIGSGGNHDGIKLSGLDDFLVVGCSIEGWGGSAIDMVGCHEGRIERCSMRNPAGEGGSGIQAKGGTRAVVIRRCRFDDAGARAVNIGGSTGLQWFRPGPEVGYEAKDVTVEGCTFRGSDSPIAFVGVDGAVARFNTIHRPRRWVVRILQETKGEGFVPSRAGRFTDNVVVFRSGELRNAVNVGPDTDPGSFTFARNLWFCEDAPERSRPKLPVAEQGGVHGRDPGLRATEDGALTLDPKGPARGLGADALPEED